MSITGTIIFSFVSIVGSYFGIREYPTKVQYTLPVSISVLATAVVDAGSGKYRKTTPSTQYSPASLPPAITAVNLAKFSGVENCVRSIMTISLKGSYLTVTLLLLINAHRPTRYCVGSSLLILPCVYAVKLFAVGFPAEFSVKGGFEESAEARFSLVFAFLEVDQQTHAHYGNCGCRS